MYSVAICSGPSQANTEGLESDSIGTFNLSGFDIGCCLLETDVPVFDQKDTLNTNNVLLKKLAFSCNYRDKTLLLNFAVNARNYGNDSPNEFLFACIGSDFVARVIDKGSNVEHLNIGDIVIPNDIYPVVPNSSAPPGIPTNEASSRLQILHKDKLIRVPDNMSVADAASFTIGAQTVYSILRKVNIDDTKKVLITSARSNTSLFAINAIKNKNNLYILTSSSEYNDKFYQMGVKNIVTVDYGTPSFFRDMQEVQKMLIATNGFDVIIDPFIDIHLKYLIGLMKFEASYISCGLYHQFVVDDKVIHQSELGRIFGALIQNNISIMGNCLGNGSDIESAIKDYANAQFKVPVDSVYSGNDIAGFFNRTYNSKERFGKVVYVYDEV